MTKPNIPNVLAGRYASDDMVTVWSSRNKVILERQLWIAVMKAQRDSLILDLLLSVCYGALGSYVDATI